MGQPSVRDFARDAEISRLYMVERRTVYEIGALFDLTPQRVSAILGRNNARKPRKTRSDKNPPIYVDTTPIE
jgi:hypothetical protein